jgi:hypothetical protein
MTAISAESDEPPAAQVRADNLPLSEDANVLIDPPQYSDVVVGAKN